MQWCTVKVETSLLMTLHHAVVHCQGRDISSDGTVSCSAALSRWGTSLLMALHHAVVHYQGGDISSDGTVSCSGALSRWGHLF